MPRISRWCLAASIALVPFFTLAQDVQTTPPGAEPKSSATATASAPVPGSLVLHATTQLVLVDVLVTDRQGNPVHGLTREDFRLTEEKTPQTPRSFEEFSSAGQQSAPQPEPPSQPPGTFVDFQPTAPRGPLNVLLIDALNTPTKDQNYLRDELRKYLSRAPAGTQIAIFRLNSKLALLQGFTSDQVVLRDAVDHRLATKTSVLLQDANGLNSEEDRISNTQIIGAARASSAHAEANADVFQTEARIRYTLGAFSSLGRFLAAFPGRKNLLWFSGSFPIDLLPDPALTITSQSMRTNSPEVRAMTNTLTRAQVAIYPIDPRGEMNMPCFDSAKGGSCMFGGFQRNLNTFDAKQGDEHTTMNTLAEQTGGRAFYHTNDITEAIAGAIDSGANFYSLSYSPANHTWDGRYRSIHVELIGSAAGQGYTLAYRRGYYAADPTHSTQKTPAAENPEPFSKPSQGTNALALAMTHGAPTPSALLLKVRVLPASTQTEKTLAPDNQLAPGTKVQGPYRRYDVDFLALPRELSLAPGPDGSRSGEVQFLIFVLDADGHLLNSMHKTVQLHLSQATYASLTQGGIRLHLQVSVPARGESYLRLAVADVPTRRMGVIEVSTAALSHLQPLPPAVAANGNGKP